MGDDAESGQQPEPAPEPEPEPEDDTQYPESLAESDDFLEMAVDELLGDSDLAKLLKLENFIERSVLVVDALPRKKIQRAGPSKGGAGCWLVPGSSSIAYCIRRG